MITGKTETGFAFEVDDDVLDDYELLEALVKVDRGDFRYITDAVDRLLGDEGKKNLLDHVRNKNGRVSSKAVSAEFMNIFSLVNGKNS